MIACFVLLVVGLSGRGWYLIYRAVFLEDLSVGDLELEISVAELTSGRLTEAYSIDDGGQVALAAEKVSNASPLPCAVAERFGSIIVLESDFEASGILEIDVHWETPPIPHPATGEVRTKWEYDGQVYLHAGRSEPLYVMWLLESDAELLDGSWRLQVQYEDEILVDEQFEVRGCPASL